MSVVQMDSMYKQSRVTANILFGIVEQNEKRNKYHPKNKFHKKMREKHTQNPWYKYKTKQSKANQTTSSGYGMYNVLTIINQYSSLFVINLMYDELFKDEPVFFSLSFFDRVSYFLLRNPKQTHKFTHHLQNSNSEIRR